jgi:hypothetical protein
MEGQEGGGPGRRPAIQPRGASCLSTFLREHRTTAGVMTGAEYSGRDFFPPPPTPAAQATSAAGGPAALSPPAAQISRNSAP